MIVASVLYYEPYQTRIKLHSEGGVRGLEAGAGDGQAGYGEEELYENSGDLE